MRYLCLLPLLMTLPVSADRCAHQRDIALEFAGDEFESLSLRALAGELDVRGHASDKIEINARMCAHNADVLDAMDVDSTTYGRGLEVTVVIPPDVWSGWGRSYAYVDVEARIPEALAVAITDSSGDIGIENIHLLSVDDSSGSIRVRNTVGDASITDSSGDINVRKHAGSLRVGDSSGTINLHNITGAIHIPADSSGDILIRGAGDVQIDGDGSGDIEVEDVTNGVRIGRDGSGSINVARVGTGGVEIGSDGSGNIRVEEVAGDFRVERKGSGNVYSDRILGMVDVPSRKR